MPADPEIMIMSEQRETSSSLPGRSAPWPLAAPVAAMLLMAACASTPAPTSALQAADQAISNAEQARVADYASPELTAAREKLTAARAAMQDEKMTLALHLAEQSRADAELATAKAAAARASAVNDDMRKGNTTLKQEMQRNSTGVTP